MTPLTGYATSAAGAAIPVHYPAAHVSRRALAVAVLLSLGAHLGVLFGLAPVRKPPVATPRVEPPLVEINTFKPEDVEEPILVPPDETGQQPELTPVPPMRPDAPTLPRENDFVQPLDLSSLVERPNTDASLVTIPPNYSRTGPVKPGDPIFSLGELQRTPVPLSQPPPTYPHAMRREALTATVVVEFIVTSAGTVANATAVNSSHPGFNDAAVAGVSKWRFRPGMRGGRNVNTRMQVPIVFRLNDEP